LVHFCRRWREMDPPEDPSSWMPASVRGCSTETPAGVAHA
jgi:hypothetical protein